MIRAIIFDCFGVLATEAWLPFKTKYFGDDPARFEQATDLGNQANRGLISYDDFLRLIGVMTNMTPDAVDSEIARNVPDEELFTYLRELKPTYKLGLLSNIARHRLEQMFADDQLALFDAITLSYKSGYIKPQPEAYSVVADQLKVSINNCMFVDDQERNVSGARTAGMQAILYRSAAQLRQELEPLLTG